MSDLIETYQKSLYDMVDESGVHPMPVFLTRLTDEGLVMEFMMSGLDAHDTLQMIKHKCRSTGVIEFIVGLDSYTAPAQGTVLDSAVIVFNVTPETARIGVWEYQWRDAGVESKPLVWDNAFWNSTYTDLAHDMQRWFHSAEKLS